MKEEKREENKERMQKMKKEMKIKDIDVVFNAEQQGQIDDDLYDSDDKDDNNDNNNEKMGDEVTVCVDWMELKKDQKVQQQQQKTQLQQQSNIPNNYYQQQSNSSVCGVIEMEELFGDKIHIVGMKGDVDRNGYYDFQQGNEQNIEQISEIIDQNQFIDQIQEGNIQQEQKYEQEQAKQAIEINIEDLKKKVIHNYSPILQFLRYDFSFAKKQIDLFIRNNNKLFKKEIKQISYPYCSKEYMKNKANKYKFPPLFNSLIDQNYNNYNNSIDLNQQQQYENDSSLSEKEQGMFILHKFMRYSQPIKMRIASRRVMMSDRILQVKEGSSVERLKLRKYYNEDYKERKLWNIGNEELDGEEDDDEGKNKKRLEKKLRREQKRIRVIRVVPFAMQIMNQNKTQSSTPQQLSSPTQTQQSTIPGFVTCTASRIVYSSPNGYITKVIRAHTPWELMKYEATFFGSIDGIQQIEKKWKQKKKQKINENQKDKQKDKLNQDENEEEEEDLHLFKYRKKYGVIRTTKDTDIYIQIICLTKPSWSYSYNASFSIWGKLTNERIINIKQQQKELEKQKQQDDYNYENVKSKKELEKEELKEKKRLEQLEKEKKNQKQDSIIYDIEEQEHQIYQMYNDQFNQTEFSYDYEVGIDHEYGDDYEQQYQQYKGNRVYSPPDYSLFMYDERTEEEKDKQKGKRKEKENNKQPGRIKKDPNKKRQEKIEEKIDFDATYNTLYLNGKNLNLNEGENKMRDEYLRKKKEKQVEQEKQMLLKKEEEQIKDLQFGLDDAERFAEELITADTGLINGDEGQINDQLEEQISIENEQVLIEREKQRKKILKEKEKQKQKEKRRQKKIFNILADAEQEDDLFEEELIDQYFNEDYTSDEDVVGVEVDNTGRIIKPQYDFNIDQEVYMQQVGNGKNYQEQLKEQKKRKEEIEMNKMVKFTRQVLLHREKRLERSLERMERWLEMNRRVFVPMDKIASGKFVFDLDQLLDVANKRNNIKVSDGNSGKKVESHVLCSAGHLLGDNEYVIEIRAQGPDQILFWGFIWADSAPVEVLFVKE